MATGGDYGLLRENLVTGTVPTQLGNWDLMEVNFNLLSNLLTGTVPVRGGAAWADRA